MVFKFSDAQAKEKRPGKTRRTAWRTLSLLGYGVLVGAAAAAANKAFGQALDSVCRVSDAPIVRNADTLVTRNREMASLSMKSWNKVAVENIRAEDTQPGYYFSDDVFHKQYSPTIVEQIPVSNPFRKEEGVKWNIAAPLILTIPIGISFIDDLAVKKASEWGFEKHPFFWSDRHYIYANRMELAGNLLEVNLAARNLTSLYKLAGFNTLPASLMAAGHILTIFGYEKYSEGQYYIGANKDKAIVGLVGAVVAVAQENDIFGVGQRLTIKVGPVICRFTEWKSDGQQFLDDYGSQIIVGSVRIGDVFSNHPLIRSSLCIGFSIQQNENGKGIRYGIKPDVLLGNAIDYFLGGDMLSDSLIKTLNMLDLIPLPAVTYDPMGRGLEFKWTVMGR